ncbi:MAG: hypothetical protein QOK19_473 [Solirubrobacteraceae bacterium]|nr:hypothetical protein [Solirubrobacteraceae bacterium]
MGAGIERCAVAGTWWRHIRHGMEPLVRLDPPPSCRWQRGAVVEATYFADEPATAWAEWYRLLSEAAIPPMRSMPRDLWRWNIDAGAVADLSSVEKLRDAHLPAPLPRQSSWKPFQECGEKLHANGFRGILAPSAVRPTHRILCLFRTGGAVVGAEPVAPPEIFHEPPAPPPGMTT